MLIRSSDEGKRSKPTLLIDTPVDDRHPAFVELRDGAILCSFFTYVGEPEDHEGGGFMRGREVALADAAAVDDPLVGGVNALGHLRVGDDFFRQVVPAPARIARRYSGSDISVTYSASAGEDMARSMAARPSAMRLLKSLVIYIHRHIHRMRKSFGIRTAVGFDHHAIEPQQHRAVVAPWVEFFAQALESERASR